MACVPSVLAQDQNSVATIKVKVRLVEVYVTVFDHKGAYVDGLKAENFQVLEDGQPRRIVAFETGENELSCAILLDTTASMREALPRVKNSVLKLIDELGPRDSVAIYTFDQRLTLRQDFTTDKEAAKRAVLRARAGGSTALFDAICEVAGELSRRHGKKAFVIFSDGDDNSSLLTANAVVSRANKLGIPLFTMAEGEATQSASLAKLLTELGESTGGASYRVDRADEIDQVFEKIAGGLRHLYLLSYTPPPGPPEGKWRKIEVTVSGVNDYRLRAKQGYYPE
jgi:VWFA-related protein